MSNKTHSGSHEKTDSFVPNSDTVGAVIISLKGTREPTLNTIKRAFAVILYSHILWHYWQLV